MFISKPIIVANWKANKVEKEALVWVEKVGKFLKDKSKAVILCPSFIHIALLKTRIDVLGFSSFIHLGAQNISHYDTGPYTGEVTAEQLAGFVEFSLVGHSERRRFFAETEQDIIQKINLAKKWKIKPILLVDLPWIGEVAHWSGEDMIVCYEPVSAISTKTGYHPDNPEHAFGIAKKIFIYNPKATVLYGGSVNSSNVRDFLNVGFSGFVVGQSSLDVNDFIDLLDASFV